MEWNRELGDFSVNVIEACGNDLGDTLDCRRAVELTRLSLKLYTTLDVSSVGVTVIPP